MGELEKYNPELMHKDQIVVISKSDMLDDELKQLIIGTFPKGLPHLFISSITNDNLEELKDTIWNTLNTDLD